MYTTCSDAGANPFISLSHNSLVSWPCPGKIRFSSCFHKQLREDTTHEAEVAWQVICSHVNSPPLEDLACRQLGKSLIAQSFSWRPSNCGRHIPKFYLNTPVSIGWAPYILRLRTPQLFICVTRATLDITKRDAVCEDRC